MKDEEVIEKQECEDCSGRGYLEDEETGERIECEACNCTGIVEVVRNYAVPEIDVLNRRT